MTGPLRRAARAPAILGRLAVDLLHADVRRHRALAQLRGLGHRLAWRAHRARLRWREPGRPVILIGMVEHFGDIVAAEPVVRHVRARHPDARIVWAVNRKYRELVETHPCVDVPLPVGCLTEWVELRAGGGFDQVIDLQVHGRCCDRCGIVLEQPEPRRAIHLGNYYDHGNLLHVFCRSAGLPVLDETPRLYIPEASRARVDGLRLPERFVAIHGTSNQASRDWNAAGWQALAERLVAEQGIAVVEVGLTPVVRPGTAGVWSLCGRLSLLDMAEVIRRAAVFVGIDSGPAHLANAVGTPGVVLLGEFGPFRRYLPYSGYYAHGGAEIVYGDGPASSIPVDRVLGAVTARLEPCRTGA